MVLPQLSMENALPSNLAGRRMKQFWAACDDNLNGAVESQARPVWPSAQVQEIVVRR